MPEATSSRDPITLSLKKGRRSAHGYVTTENVEAVREYLQRLLFDQDGEARPFTWIEVYEYAGWRPRVRTGQVAEKVEVSNKGERGAVTVVDTSSVWTLAGRLTEQPRTESDHRKALEKSSWIEVDEDHLTVRLRTPEGKLAWWRVEVEQLDKGGR